MIDLERREEMRRKIINDMTIDVFLVKEGRPRHQRRKEGAKRGEEERKKEEKNGREVTRVSL